MSGLTKMRSYIKQAQKVRVYVAATIHDGHWVSISKEEAKKLIDNTIGPDQPITDIRFGFDEETKILRIG